MKIKIVYNSMCCQLKKIGFEGKIFMRIYYSVVLFIIIIICIMNIVFICKSKLDRTKVLFIALLAAISADLFSFAGDMLIYDVGIKYQLQKINFMSVFLIPPIWIMFVTSYYEMTSFMNKKIIAALFIIPVISAGLSLTNEFHNLLWTGYEINNLNLLTTIKGKWFYIAQSVYLAEIAAAIIISAINVYKSVKGQKIYSIILLTALILPNLVEVIFNIILNDKTKMGLTPAVLGISVLIVSYTIVRGRLFEITPIAKEILIDTMQEGILVLNKEGKPIFMNAAFKNYFGDRIDENLKGKIADYFNTIFEDTTKNEIKEYIYNNTYFEVKQNIITNKRGKIIGRMLMINDISAKKNIERELIEAKEKAERANKYKDTFLAEISHELKTPLNGIMGISELILLNDNGEVRMDYVEQINIAAKHVLNLVNDIVKQQHNNSKKEVFLFDNLLEEVKRTYVKDCMDKNIMFLCYNSKENNEFLYGNYSSISQILINLAGNAVKYTEKGGIIIKSYIKSKNKGIAKICIEIRDTGIGIEEENVDKIFEPGYREKNVKNIKYEGYGLGLSVVKKIADELQWDILLKSKKGIGSTFYVEAEFGIEDKKIINVKREIKENIVLISANKIINEFFIMFFNDYGIEYFLFENVCEYIEIAEEIDERSKIIITDEKVDDSRLGLKNSDKVILLKNVEDNESGAQYIGEIDRNRISEMLFGKKENDEKDVRVKKKIKISKFKNLNALILEDNELNILVLRDIIKMAGVSFDIARSVDEALGLLEEKSYNIIFSDLWLGDSDGIKFLERAGNIINRSTIKVVITASTTAQIREECIDAGFDEFVEKPYEAENIMSILNKYFFEYIDVEDVQPKNIRTKNEYTKVFAEQMKKELNYIEKLLDNSNYEEIAKISHKVKGGAAILKEMKIVSLLFEIENYTQKKKNRLIYENICKIREELRKEPEN